MSLAAGARKPLTLGPSHSVVRLNRPGAIQIALNARLSAEADAGAHYAIRPQFVGYQTLREVR